MTTPFSRRALKMEAGESISFGQNGIQYTHKNKSKCFQLEDQPSTHHLHYSLHRIFERKREKLNGGQGKRGKHDLESIRQSHFYSYFFSGQIRGSN